MKALSSAGEKWKSRMWILLALAGVILLLVGIKDLRANQSSSRQNSSTSKEIFATDYQAPPNPDSGSYRVGTFTDTPSLTAGYRGLFPSLNASQTQVRYLGYRRGLAFSWVFGKSRERILGRIPGPASAFEVWRWSPNSNKALVLYTRGKEVCNDCWFLFDYSAGDLVARRLTGGVLDIVWSPDGSRVLATVMSEDSFPMTHLVISDANFSGQKLVAVLRGGGWKLDWKQPQKAVIWHDQEDAEGPMGFPIRLLDMSSDKPIVRTFVSGFNARASLSPNGHWLAFEKVFVQGQFSWLMNTFTRKVAKLPSGSLLKTLRWSEDGKWLAFERVDPDAKDKLMAHAIVLINLNKGEIVKRFKPKDAPVIFSLRPIGFTKKKLYYEHENFIKSLTLPD